MEDAHCEALDAHAGRDDMEVRVGRLEIENAELAAAGRDLAAQVEGLLQRRAADTSDLVGVVDVRSMQERNQCLLSEHRAMTSRRAAFMFNH